MSLYKRGEYWWVGFTAPNGERIRKSAGTGDRQKAQEYHDRLKLRYWEIHKLGVRPRRTWQEAVVQWIKETTHKRTHDEDVKKLQWWDRFLRDKYLDQINREVIESGAEVKEREGASPATVNRYLAIVRSILRRAASDWEWIDRVPKVRMRRESQRRIRFLSRTEAEQVLQQLPGHLAEMARFALATGLRMSNVALLKWSQVNLDSRLAWIHPDEAKAGRAIGVALNGEAMSVLQRQLGKHETSMFTYRGKPVLRCSTHAWYKAVKRAGVIDFRWHDWRHTWASWHAQAGTPLSVLQELGGWNSAEMVRRYAHLTAAHLLTYAERISNNTKLAQNTTMSEGADVTRSGLKIVS